MRVTCTVPTQLPDRTEECGRADVVVRGLDVNGEAYDVCARCLPIVNAINAETVRLEVE